MAAPTLEARAHSGPSYTTLLDVTVAPANRRGNSPSDSSIPHGARLETLISRFLGEYAEAQNFHRVLTEDVRFLPPKARDRILDKERYVVQAFADAVGLVRPDVKRAALEKPVAMLLFGMLNWMFTWLRPEGKLTHAAVAPLVCDLFLNGLNGLTALPLKRERRPAIRSSAK